MDELHEMRAPAEDQLAARAAHEKVKRELAAARADVTGAAWSEGRLAQAESLGRAIEVLLAGILADARAGA
jgi:hypothetical protein